MLVIYPITLSASEKIELTIEELRVEKAQQAMPMLKEYFDWSTWSTFKCHWLKVNDFAIVQRAMNQLELTSLIESFEKSSRGYSDMDYVKSTNKRILLTGFDPFLLDRNLYQFY